MKTPSILKIAALLIAASVSGLSAQESAAPAESPADTAAAPTGTEAVGGVVVSASRVAEDAKNSPASVTVITAAGIAASGKNTLPELLERVAGVSFRYLGGPASAEISMRGFGENSFGRVVVLVDGKRLNNPDMKGIDWLSIPLADIARIEVLHGPAAALYGNGAIGGVVNIVTAKPAKPLEVSTSAGVASDWTNRESARLGIAGEVFALGASFEHYGTEGYRDRNGVQSSHAGLSLDLYPADTVIISAGARVADITYELPGSLTKAQIEENPRQAVNQDDDTREHGVGADLAFAWTPSGQFALSVPFDFDFQTVDANMASWFSYSTRDSYRFEARPQATGTIDLGGPSLRITGGLDLRSASLQVANYLAKDRKDTSGNVRLAEQLNIASFAALRLNIVKELALDASLRYDNVNTRQSKYDSVTYNITNALISNVRTNEALVYDFGVNVRPVDELQIYARFGSLFRYPFVDEIFAVMTDTVWDLVPETGINLEVGAALDIDKLLSLNLSAYYLNLHDEIGWVPDFTSVDYGYNDNIGQTDRFGLEASVRFTPFEFLELDAAYAFVDARFVEGENAGKLVPLVSQHDFKAGLSAVLPFGLSFGPSVHYRGESYAGGDFANEGDKIPEYFLLDASVRFVTAALDGKLSLLATVENLLDLAYAPVVFSYGAYYPAPGRTFSFSLSYSY